MNRNKYKPAAKELYSWDHWNARKEKPLHPFQVVCLSVAGISLFTLGVCLFVQAVAACSTENDPPPFEVLTVCLWSVIGLGCSLIGLVVWNLFDR
jgi:hypothetical protein